MAIENSSRKKLFKVKKITRPRNICFSKYWNSISWPSPFLGGRILGIPIVFLTLNECTVRGIGAVCANQLRWLFSISIYKPGCILRIFSKTYLFGDIFLGKR
jgi:hypothetical protein